jgi:hypothetical protein
MRRLVTSSDRSGVPNGDYHSWYTAAVSLQRHPRCKVIIYVLGTPAFMSVPCRVHTLLPSLFGEGSSRTDTSRVGERLKNDQGQRPRLGNGLKAPNSATSMGYRVLV